MILFRGTDVPDFTTAEAALLGPLSAGVADALRRVQLAARAAEQKSVFEKTVSKAAAS
jgi:hypothetical protein